MDGEARLELVRERPSRRARGAPQRLLVLDEVDLGDRAVHLVGQLIPLGLEVVVVGVHFGEALGRRRRLCDGEAPGRQLLAQRGVGRERGSF